MRVHSGSDEGSVMKGGEALSQRSECPPAVAHFVLLPRRSLGEGFAQVVTQEQGIVAEPTVPPRSIQDHAGAALVDQLRRRRRRRAVGEDAPKPGPPLRSRGALEPAEELGIVRRVERGPGYLLGNDRKPLRPHPGRAAKRQHLEAGIVRDRRERRATNEMLRL